MSIMLTRSDWIEAQDLLLTLVQTATLLAEGKEERPLPKWSQSFFSFPTGQQREFDHTVSLLKTTLTTVQKEMTQWLERLPPAEESVVLLPPDEKEDLKPNTSLSFQAQRFVGQVREAIGTLCSSSQIVEPKIELLRKTLTRLRPMVDELIEAISQEGSRSTDHETDRHMRPPLPTPVRGHLFKKLSKSISPEEKAQSTPQRIDQRIERGEGEKKPKSLPAEEEKGTPIATARNEGTVTSKQQILSLSAAPFFPQTKTLSASKKKKKRKGFWLREEKDDPANS